MSNFKIQDMIRYADGEMGAAEKEDFELALKDDAALQADLKLYKDVNSSLKVKFSPSKADQDFKDNLESFTKKNFQENKEESVIKIFTLNKLWYAAAILIIGLLVWAPWNKDLYHQYADTKMVSFAERGNDDNSALQNATNAFNSKNYQEAKKLLIPLVKEQFDNDMLMFYLAVSQVETNELEEARFYLSNVYQKESLFKYDAAFYIALSYLKEKNEAKSKEWLVKIPSDADCYQKAKELLSKL